MKLARLGSPGTERLAALDSKGRYRDLSADFPDLTRQLLTNLTPLLALDLAKYPIVEGAPRI